MAVGILIQLFFVFLPAVVAGVGVSWWRKSRRTVLLHLGHLGSASASMTYIRQRGHPASIIDDDEASGLLLEHTSVFTSDDRHELVGDVAGDSARRLFPLCGVKFSFNSSSDPFPFRLLIFDLLIYLITNLLQLNKISKFQTTNKAIIFYYIYMTNIYPNKNKHNIRSSDDTHV